MVCSIILSFFLNFFLRSISRSDFKIDQNNLIMKRLKNSSLLLTGLLGLAATESCSVHQEEVKPNILYFLVDDMGGMDAHYLGSDFYETPNMDRLASQGVKFTNAYVSHPRCVPSRYSIMTGKYPARINRPGPGKMKLEEVTVAEGLKEAGYSTFFAGKWHLTMGGESMPENQGFDYNIAGGHAGAPISYFYPYNSPAHHQFKIPILGLEDGHEDEYLTDRLTTETIEYLKQHVGNHPDQPFFAFLSHYGVHEPFHAKKEYIEKFKRKLDSIEFKQPEFIRESHGYTKMRQDNAEYAAMLYSVDESLGRLMKTLEDLKQMDNTIVVFYSDNGGLSNTGTEVRPLATSNYPLRAGKGHLYEGGVRVPLVVKWNGVTKPGSICNALITGTDFFPAFLEASGMSLRPQDHLDGQSFLWALKGEQNPNPQRAIYWHNCLARPLRTGDYNSTAVRRGKYKLIDFYLKDSLELYNVEDDIMESENLADKLPEERDELLQLIQDWRKDVNANMTMKESKSTVKEYNH
ncbi:arylsulfatase A-like enzyme [Marinifilum flexuosum]|uniref:Arylsulfatase A-like enzyme n=2 Tax=Marinifilum flexuosum TaxID=1117708 RepID=A0A419X9Y1_9BACT|nr:arylsulfatase A-like enzyme [Marinifilum flexuosum]